MLVRRLVRTLLHCLTALQSLHSLLTVLVSYHKSNTVFQDNALTVGHPNRRLERHIYSRIHSRVRHQNSGFTIFRRAWSFSFTESIKHVEPPPIQMCIRDSCLSKKKIFCILSSPSIMLEAFLPVPSTFGQQLVFLVFSNRLRNFLRRFS